MKKAIKSLLLILLVLITGFVCGCGSDSVPEVASGASKLSKSNNLVDESEMIIYRCNYRIYSNDIATLISQADQKLSEVHGYKDTENSGNGYCDVTYRVPVEHFEEFLTYLDSFEGIYTKELSSENVTSSYNEYAAKIATLEASKAAYTALLNKEGITIEDVIILTDKISDIDSKILYYETEKARLENKTDYTFVRVHYNQEDEPVERSEFIEFFMDYGHYLVAFVIFIAKAILYLLPFGVIAGVVLLIVFKPFKKHREKKAELDKE